MKARVNLDKRCEMDKKWDKLWNEMVRKANLTSKQIPVVSAYLRALLQARMHEVESACDMAWILALVESEGFGTNVNRGANRLLRVQQYAVDARNDAYGHDCLNANGVIEYDGCGLVRLQSQLKRYNIEYDTKIEG